MATFTNSIRGKTKVILNSHSYVQKYIKKCGTIVWRCSNSKCRGRVEGLEDLFVETKSHTCNRIPTEEEKQFDAEEQKRKGRMPIVHCLFCGDSFLFEFNKGIRGFDTKIKLFCEAFELTGGMFEEKLKMSPFCNNCVALIESIGVLVKYIQEIGMKLNLQKEIFRKLLEQETVEQSMEEDSVFDLFSPYEFRQDIRKELNISPSSFCPMDIKLENTDGEVGPTYEDYNHIMGTHPNLEEGNKDPCFEFVGDNQEPSTSRTAQLAQHALPQNLLEDHQLEAFTESILPDDPLNLDCPVLPNQPASNACKKPTMKIPNRKRPLEQDRQDLRLYWMQRDIQRNSPREVVPVPRRKQLFLQGVVDGVKLKERKTSVLHNDFNVP